MAATVEVTDFLLRSGTGTQDVTIGTEDCRGYLLIVTQQDVNGVEGADANLGLAMVGTNGTQFCLNFMSQDNVPTTVGRTNAENGRIMEVYDGANVNQYLAEHLQFIPGGFQINVLTDLTNARAKAFIFYGDDINIELSQIASSATDGVEVTTPVTQQADFMFTMGRIISSVTGSLSDFRGNLGAAMKKASVITQFGNHFTSPTARATAASKTVAMDNRIGCIADAGGTIVDTCWEVTTMTPTVLGLTTRRFTGSGAASTHYFMSINFGGAIEFDLGALTLPTVTGNEAVTGIGFEPQAVFIGTASALSYQQEGGLHSPQVMFNSGMADGVREHSVSMVCEDNAPTSNTGTMPDDQVVHFLDELGADEHVATFVSFDPDGFTFNYTVANAAYVGYYAAFQDEQAKIAQVTVGTWSSTVAFAPGDTLRLTADGAAVNNPRIRVNIGLDPT